jgi:hypothetical protein
MFYKPGMQFSFSDTSLCSLQDIVPTIYGLQQNATKSGLNGIDLFSGIYKTGQFYLLHDLHQMGWIAPHVNYLATYQNGTLLHPISNKPDMTDSISAMVLSAYKVYADILR